MQLSFLEFSDQEIDSITFSSNHEQERKFLKFIVTALKNKALELNAYNHQTNSEMSWFSSSALLDGAPNIEETRAAITESLKNSLGLKVIHPED